MSSEYLAHASKPTATWQQLHKHTQHATATAAAAAAEVCGNRQARVVLEDRMKYSLQLTALRLNPRRLRGVQALT